MSLEQQETKTTKEGLERAMAFARETLEKVASGQVNETDAMRKINRRFEPLVHNAWLKSPQSPTHNNKIN